MIPQRKAKNQPRILIDFGISDKSFQTSVCDQMGRQCNDEIFLQQNKTKKHCYSEHGSSLDVHFVYEMHN